MSNPGDADDTPITATRQMVEWFLAGCKPRERFAIGTEHEKFGFQYSNLTPPAYEPDGIRAVLAGMARSRGDDGNTWTPILDAGNPIGLKSGSGSVSLEPAGQLELSGAPLATLHDTHAEITAHFELVRRAAQPLGIGFAPLGFQPTMTRAQMPWMPKRRYAIMRRYMPLVGKLGLDMMTRTCTVQVNLDFESEPDMVRKLRVALALQPLATALFANSPFVEGRPSGLLSSRANVWTDTDADRTGIPAVFFEDGFGFERYVDWLLDVPMYFVTRGGEYVDLAGLSFRRFLQGELTDAAVGPATIGDFADHVTTVFTDVRLKRFLEMRGADAGTLDMMVAQSALWVGLLYDPDALASADALVRRRPWADYIALRAEVPRTAMGTRWQSGTLRDLAREVLQIAAAGLRARNLRDGLGRDERIYLGPLDTIAAGGPTQAERWLDRYHTAWGGDASRIFREAEI